jgi:hypothetical protein
VSARGDGRGASTMHGVVFYEPSTTTSNAITHPPTTHSNDRTDDGNGPFGDEFIPSCLFGLLRKGNLQ